MVHLIRSEKVLWDLPELLVQDEEKKILIFRRKNCIFALNFSATGSYADYGFAAPAGEWVDILDSDDPKFNGFGRTKAGESHFTVPEKSPNGNPRYEDTLFLYLPSRSAVVLKKL
jgi:1,4-alpha-glucan branching enzyme